MDVTSYLGMAAAVIVIETGLVVALLRRRAEGSRAGQLLEDRLRFETLLVDVSAKLIHVDAAGLDAALGAALQQAVNFLGMDRGNLDEYVDGSLAARIAWTEPGLQPLPSILTGGQFKWTMETLQRGGIVRFSGLDDLPASASADRAAYARLGTRSYLSIPLRAGGPLLGVLSFDSVRAERKWPDELVHRLWLLSEAFAGALERKRMELSLGNRLRFHRLLSDLSARFSNVAAVDFEREVHNALRRIVESVGVERATLLEFVDGGGRGRSWAVDEPMDRDERFPWVLARVRRGDEVRISRIAELPDEAPVDRASWVARGLTSQVAMPLKAGGGVLGALVLAADSGGRAWPDELMEQLRLVCEVMANAFATLRAERESGRLRQELAHIGRVSALGELTASLAHELNQPLTAILNNAEVAQQRLEAEVINVAALREILEDIVADDKRAAGVIRRLRALLKKGSLEYVTLNINDVVSEVAHLVRNDAIMRSVPVTLELAADLPRVSGDRAQLQQVVLNMVLNGLEAMGASNGHAHTLVIRTSAVTGSTVVVAVEDSGTGIDVADLDRLFQPLYTTKADGLGMGLAISRTIVTAHGGQLRASNNPGGGATFEFTLPVHPEAETS
jgi:signal transduction histidine kinase